MYTITIFSMGSPKETTILGDLEEVINARGFVLEDPPRGGVKLFVTKKVTGDGTSIAIGLGRVRLDEHRIDNRSKRRTKTLSPDDWIVFNNVVNDWLDARGWSAEVKSSSYVIRLRNKRRVTFTPGNYHGVDDEWQKVA